MKENSTSLELNKAETEKWSRYLTFLTIYLSIFTFFFIFSITYKVFTLNELASELLFVDVKMLPFIFGIITFGAFFQIVFRRLADNPRVGRKKSFILFGITNFSLILISYFIPNLIIFMVLRFIALFFGMTFASLIISEEVPAKYRGRVAGMVQGIGMSSSVIIAFIASFFDLLPPHSWQYIFLFVMGPGIILIIILGFYMKETKRFSLSIENNERSSIWGVFKKNKLKTLALAALLLLCVQFTFITIKSYFKPDLIERGYTNDIIGWIAFFAYFGSIFGYYSSGFLSDKIGRKKTIYISALIYLIGSNLYIFFDFYTTVFIGFFISNLTFSVFYCTADLVTAEFFHTSERSTAQGWILFFGGAGLILGNMFMTPLSFLIGWKGAFFWIGTIAIIALFIILKLIPETKGRILEEIVQTEIEGIM